MCGEVYRCLQAVLMIVIMFPLTNPLNTIKSQPWVPASDYYFIIVHSLSSIHLNYLHFVHWRHLAKKKPKREEKKRKIPRMSSLVLKICGHVQEEITTDSRALPGNPADQRASVVDRFSHGNSFISTVSISGSAWVKRLTIKAVRFSKQHSYRTSSTSNLTMQTSVGKSASGHSLIRASHLANKLKCKPECLRVTKNT